MSTCAMKIAPNPPDAWIDELLAVSQPSLMREAIMHSQLEALKETVAWAGAHSSFYARRLAGFPVDLPGSLADIKYLPLTAPDDIADHSHEFLCVSQDMISRIVTMDSSGTNGAPKRIFFTAPDQELALDFFAHGVAAMASHGDRMLIALPGEREGSVGYQLARGIARAGVIPIPHGFSIDPAQTLAHMEHERATCIIGLPVQILALARSNCALADNVFRRLGFIVLCSDHVPDCIVNTLRMRFDGEVFQHYGSTEMGLGGGVDCASHLGYHLRENDLYFEIISPATGEPLPDGEMGEVVFTTLRRRGMPLIRYRTGDLSRLLPSPCACGSMIKRLDKIRGRIGGQVSVGSFGPICIAMLDEALFVLPGLLDFHVTCIPGTPTRLQLVVYAPEIADSTLKTTVFGALSTLPAIRNASVAGELELSVTFASAPLPSSGAKRKIEVRSAR